MNKFLSFAVIACTACFCGALSACATAETDTAASSEPVLRIREFGTEKPVVEAKLCGETQEFSGNGWTCRAEKVTKPLPGWRLSFTSTRHDDPARLTVTFTSPLDFRPVRFWDGSKERKADTLPLERKEMLETFPLATAENGTQGRALGFAPQTILSEFSRALTAEGLALEARIVSDDRRVQVLDIVDYTFTPDFAWCNAVEDYQDAYPEWFRPIPGADKRIYGVSAYFLGGALQRPFQLHSWRHSGLSWEWTFAPWYEAGKWYAPGEGWDGETQIYWDYYGHRKEKRLTRQEYDEALKQEMLWGDKVAAMMFYILVKDIHESVADRYPETVMPGLGELHSRPTNAGHLRSAFAPGSALFDYLKRQLKGVVDHYEVSGFSLDMANSSYHFTTPSQLEYAVGRSWYDDGTIYTSDSVEPIPFSDYLHTLKRNGKPMATMFNAAVSEFSPFTFFHCDGAIMEAGPAANADMVLALRLTLGRKPFTFWHGLFSGVRRSLYEGDPEKTAEIMQGIKQNYLLNCYRYGCNPMNWVSADTLFRSHLDTLRAISEAGYHPVSAIRDAEPLWAGRFGDGAETILTFSNPKREKVTRTVRVVNRYLGEGKYGFLPSAGTLAQKIANGETVFELTLEPKEIVVLRTVALKGEVTGFTACANEKSLRLQADAPFAFTLPSADFDGRCIRFGEKFISGKAEKSVSFDLLPACGTFAPEKNLTAFLAERQTPALEAGAGRDVQIAAEMVAMYRPSVKANLKRWGRINSNHPGFLDPALSKPDLILSAPGQGAAGKKILVGTPGDFPGLEVPENFPGPFLAMPDADTLWIGGSTPEQVRKAALKYFDLLDGEWSSKQKKAK